MCTIHLADSQDPHTSHSKGGEMKMYPLNPAGTGHGPDSQRILLKLYFNLFILFFMFRYTKNADLICVLWWHLISLYKKPFNYLRYFNSNVSSYLKILVCKGTTQTGINCWCNPDTNLANTNGERMSNESDQVLSYGQCGIDKRVNTAQNQREGHTSEWQPR